MTNNNTTTAVLSTTTTDTDYAGVTTITTTTTVTTMVAAPADSAPIADDADDDDTGADFDDACPGCGCRPGDGVTGDCSHPDGCGFADETPIEAGTAADPDGAQVELLMAIPAIAKTFADFLGADPFGRGFTAAEFGEYVVNIHEVAEEMEDGADPSFAAYEESARKLSPLDLGPIQAFGESEFGAEFTRAEIMSIAASPAVTGVPQDRTVAACAAFGEWAAIVCLGCHQAEVGDLAEFLVGEATDEHRMVGGPTVSLDDVLVKVAADHEFGATILGVAREIVRNNWINTLAGNTTPTAAELAAEGARQYDFFTGDNVDGSAEGLTYETCLRIAADEMKVAHDSDIFAAARVLLADRLLSAPFAG